MYIEMCCINFFLEEPYIFIAMSLNIFLIYGNPS